MKLYIDTRGVETIRRYHCSALKFTYMPFNDYFYIYFYARRVRVWSGLVPGPGSE